jgi:hypothetical protein
MGLAEETAPGVWRVMPEMEPALRRMGERGDIIKTMHRDLAAVGIHRAAADRVISDGQAGAMRVLGRLVAEGVSDELHDRRYVIVDGIDGRTHYADLGVRQAADDPLIRNTIVEVRARDVSPRDVDRSIADVARRNHGVYSAERIERSIRRRPGSTFRRMSAGWKRYGGKTWSSAQVMATGPLVRTILNAQVSSRPRSDRATRRGSRCYPGRASTNCPARQARPGSTSNSLRDRRR